MSFGRYLFANRRQTGWNTSTAVEACAERWGTTQHEHRGVSAARRHFDSDVMATCHLSNVALALNFTALKIFAARPRTARRGQPPPEERPPASGAASRCVPGSATCAAHQVWQVHHPRSACRARATAPPHLRSRRPASGARRASTRWESPGRRGWRARRRAARARPRRWRPCACPKLFQPRWRRCGTSPSCRPVISRRTRSAPWRAQRPASSSLVRRPRRRRRPPWRRRRHRTSPRSGRRARGRATAAAGGGRTGRGRTDRRRAARGPAPRRAAAGGAATRT